MKRNHENERDFRAGLCDYMSAYVGALADLCARASVGTDILPMPTTGELVSRLVACDDGVIIEYRTERAQPGSIHQVAELRGTRLRDLPLPVHFRGRAPRDVARRIAVFRNCVFNAARVEYMEVWGGNPELFLRTVDPVRQAQQDFGWFVATSELPEDAMRGASLDDLQQRVDQVAAVLEEVMTGAKQDQEQRLQELLQDGRFRWLLSLGHRVVPRLQLGVGKELEVDFAVQHLNPPYWELIELEAPYKRLFKPDGDVYTELQHALDQVEQWQGWIKENRRTAEEKYPGIGTNHGTVVIGRDGTLDHLGRGRLRQKNESNSHITIMTWDQLVAGRREELSVMACAFSEQTRPREQEETT